MSSAAGSAAAFVDDLVGFAHWYAGVAREDHRLFVDAFRAGRVPGVQAVG